MNRFIICLFGCVIFGFSCGKRISSKVNGNQFHIQLSAIGSAAVSQIEMQEKKEVQENISTIHPLDGDLNELLSKFDDVFRVVRELIDLMDEGLSHVHAFSMSPMSSKLLSKVLDAAIISCVQHCME